MLDVGCATGEHVLLSVGIGLEATGVDLASAALHAATEKARDRGRAARFLMWDARKLADLGESFDTVLDCGLFHIVTDEDRAAFVNSLRSVVAPGGRYFMLCFSDQQPGDSWPRVRRVTETRLQLRSPMGGGSTRSNRPRSTSPPTRTASEPGWSPSPGSELAPRGIVMLTSEACVETDRPSRYLVQLCRHFNHQGRHLPHRPRTHHGGEWHAHPEGQAQVEWSETHGTVNFGWDQCTMQATPDTLTLRAEAADEETLQRIQGLLAGHLNRFGRRDDLTVNWQRPIAPAGQPGDAISAAPAPTARAVAGRKRRRTIGLAVAGALVIAVHLRLGGAALAASRWTGWTADIVLAVVVVKVIGVTVIALHRLATRRSRAAKAPASSGSPHTSFPRLGSSARSSARHGQDVGGTL